jgi:GLPGLI family protein
MKKELLLLPLLLLLFTNKIFSQNNGGERKLYICSYNTVYNSRLNSGKMWRPFDSKLYIADSLSLFLTVANKETFKRQQGDENDVIFDTLFKIIKIPSSNLLLFSDYAFSNGKEKQYTDTLYPMQWELSNEKKLIDTFECFMAKTFLCCLVLSKNTNTRRPMEIGRSAGPDSGSL